MRDEQTVRLECLRLANALAISKAIHPGDVVASAEKFLTFLEGRSDSARDLLEADRKPPIAIFGGR